MLVKFLAVSTTLLFIYCPLPVGPSERAPDHAVVAMHKHQPVARIERSTPESGIATTKAIVRHAVFNNADIAHDTAQRNDDTSVLRKRMQRKLPAAPMT